MMKLTKAIEPCGWRSLFDCRYACCCLQWQLLFAFSAFGCWLGGRKGIRPVEWWGAGVVICLERGADLHMAQLMPLPLTVSCFSKIQIGFTFLVPAYLVSPGQRAVVKRLFVCVCGCVCSSIDNTDCSPRCLSYVSRLLCPIHLAHAAGNSVSESLLPVET